MKKLFGAVEGGGTKFFCIVGSSPEEIAAETTIPTTTPGETLARAASFFKQFDLASIGIATFGPVELDPASPRHGFITSTPKPGWKNVDILSFFKQEFAMPISFDLDVNSAVFGEYTWVRANRELHSLAYMTIGTGIGAGFIVNGKLLHGLSHPEAGHMRLPHDRKKDPFPGICPFHRDCFEGLASGSSLACRWRKPAEELPPTHPAWELESTYIAQAVHNLILTHSPQRMVLGGGVMKQAALLPLIRRKVRALLNGYIDHPILKGDMQEYLVTPALGDRSGVLGALAQAKGCEKSSL